MRILASPAFSNSAVNPYNALLYQALQTKDATVDEYSHKRALTGHYDIAHFHWPDGYVNTPNLFKAWQRAILLTSILMLLKLKGTRIVWTVHNVFPHDAHHPKLSENFMHGFVSQCAGLIFMTSQSQSAFQNHYPTRKDLKSVVIPHGHYRSSYSDKISPAEAKEWLGLKDTDKVLLFFGMVKPYKNVDGLIEAFVQASLPDYTLVIAGNPDSRELAERITSLSRSHPRILPHLKFIPENDVHRYFSAADIAVLPYSNILNSGALLLSLSFNVPVIAPSIGAMKDLQETLGSAWIHNYQAEFNHSALQSAVTQLGEKSRPAECPLSAYDWHNLAASTRQFYQTVVTGAPPATGKAAKQTS